MGFQKLDPRDLLISSEAITDTVWENNNPSLSSFYTSSTQTLSNSGQYYYNIYSEASALGLNQFSIAYCDKKGSGSLWYNASVNGSSPTRTNYGQYRTLILGDEDLNFVFGNQTSEHFYALPIERSGYKESILPGSLTMQLLSGSTSILYLTDDSNLNTSAVFTDAGRRYNLVSGSAGSIYTGVNSNGWTVNSGSYGWVLPDVGIILLSGAALDGEFADGGIKLSSSRQPNLESNNPQKLFNSLNGGGLFSLNSKETLSSDYIFVRGRNNELNYSTNPSFISGSTGVILFNSFINNPQVYITTVGLYNDRQELLAVAKLSRPLLKDFTKELLIRIKLSF
jgi:hypothetical protein